MTVGIVVPAKASPQEGAGMTVRSHGRVATGLVGRLCCRGGTSTAIEQGLHPDLAAGVPHRLGPVRVAIGLHLARGQSERVRPLIREIGFGQQRPSVIEQSSPGPSRGTHRISLAR